MAKCFYRFEFKNYKKGTLARVWYIQPDFGNPSICTTLCFLPVPEKGTGKFDSENVLHFSLIIDLTIEKYQ